MRLILLELISVLVLLAGVALLSVPIALILAGLAGIFASERAMAGGEKR